MKLLITQREEKNEHGDRIDSLEANYIEFFLKEKFEIIPVPNNLEAAKRLLWEAPDLIVLSGGGSITEQTNRNEVETKLIEYCLKHNVPLLGICRGMQFINKYFGGKIVKNNIHPNEREHDLVLTNQNLIECLKRKRGPVNSYHNFTVSEKDLAKELEVFGVSNYGLIEGFFHKNKKIVGVQWHPERTNGLSQWIDKFILNNLIR